jgi:excisionase family DNA binding protein
MSLPIEHESAPPPTLFSLEEAADRLHCGKSTLRKMVQDRRVPHVKMSPRLPIQFTAEHIAEIVKIFERRPVTPGPAGRR